MMNITDWIIPLITVFVLIYATIKRVDVFSAFCEGAGEGLKTCADILPALVLLLVCIGMFRASGAVDALTNALKPLCSAVGFPSDAVPLVVLRPFSGSGAMAVYNEIAATAGADTFAERVAATLIGSSETTFYTAAVYFSAVKCKRTRCAVPAALTADLTAWVVCGGVVFLFFGG
ncbi:MAG: spore maturation protein [Oscillospiraceae bacterium]|nr:spore maturation protein [Oscillospiraceae bacterium]